jgi:hypothetical protein
MPGAFAAAAQVGTEIDKTRIIAITIDDTLILPFFPLRAIFPPCSIPICHTDRQNLLLLLSLYPDNHDPHHNHPSCSRRLILFAVSILIPTFSRFKHQNQKN